MSVYHTLETYHDYYSNSPSSRSSPSSSSDYSMNTDGSSQYHGGSMSSPMSGNTSPISSCMSTISSSDSSSAYNFQHLQISQSSNEFIYSMNVRMDGPFLEIVEQPIDKFRFRYESEMHGTHGMLTTQHSKKSFPSVRLRNFNGEALIRCSLFQMITPGREMPAPHSHSLVVRCGNKNKKDPHDVVVSQQHGYIANFQGMGIIHTAKKFIEGELLDKFRERAEFESGRKITEQERNTLEAKAKKYSTEMNLNQVILYFEAYERVNDKWSLLCPPVYSTPINNLKSALTGELKISRMSTVVGSAAGNEDLFMFVEKVGKKNIKVRFFEVDEDDRVVWENFGRFTEADVHHQYAIALKTPPYRRTNIDENVKVYVQLFRPKDEAISEPVEFRYKPTYSSNRKRPRVSSFYDSDIPVVVTENAYGHNSADCYVPQNDSVMDDIDPEQLVQNLFSDNQSELALNSEDFSLLLRQLANDETAELDNLAKDSVSSDGKSVPKLSKEERVVDKVLRKTEPLLKMDDNSKMANVARKLLEFLMRKVRFNGDSISHICVKCDDLKLMERLWKILHKFQLYEWLELRNYSKETCTHLASELNKPCTLAEIIKHSTNVNAVDVDGNTALHVAIKENRDECVETLLEANYEVNQIDLGILNDNGYTPLHLACLTNNLKVVKMLDAKAIKTNQMIFDDVEGKHGNNALHIAIESEATQIVEYIMQNKRINPSKMNKSGHTALYLARVTKSIEMLHLIQRHASSNDERLMDNDDDDSSSKDSFDSQDTSFIIQKKKLIALKKKIADSNKLEAKGDDKPFDDRCFTALSEIFNRSSKWESIASILNFDDCIPIWQKLRNPTKALLMYTESDSLRVAKSTLTQIFSELGEQRAVDCMREWKNRV